MGSNGGVLTKNAILGNYRGPTRPDRWNVVHIRSLRVTGTIESEEKS